MSYSIIYDKQFVKVEENNTEKFIPFVLIGDNNCYDFNNRRTRNWHNFSYILNGEGFSTLEKMLSKAEKERDSIIKRNNESNEKYIKEDRKDWTEDYSDDRWGYFTSLSIGGSTTKTTFNNYKGIFKTGCKKAVTVEELFRSNHGSISIETPYNSKSKLEKYNIEEFKIIVTTSKELVEKFREAEKTLSKTGISPIIKLNAVERIAKNIRTEFFKTTKKVKIGKEVSQFFEVRDSINGNVVLRTTKNGYRFSHSGTGKKFRLESEATRYAKKLCDKYFEKNRFIVNCVKRDAIFYI